MRLETQFKRLNKLSKEAGVDARCAYCQFALRQTFSTETHPKPDPDKILVTCEWCGTKYNAHLPADPLERAVRLEIEHDTIAQSYSTHRKRALHIWADYRRRVLNPKPKAKEKPPTQDKPTPAQKKRAEMLTALYKLIHRTHTRARRDAPKFPDLDELEAVLLRTRFSSDATSEFERNMYLESRTKQLDALAILETMLWNEPRPETLVAIEAHQEAINERIERQAKEAKEREEKQERERLEREQHRKDMPERTRPISAVRFCVTDPIERPVLTEDAPADDFWKRELSRPPVIEFSGDVETQLASHAPDPNPLASGLPCMRVNR